jgi:hypothetical protein
MTDCDGARAKWANSRLKALPAETFYHAVVLLAMGRSASFVARWLLCLPDRGPLQTATFHTLRTYLTPINQQLGKWRRSFYADPVPDIVQEAQKWLSQPTGGAG